MRHSGFKYLLIGSGCLLSFLGLSAVLAHAFDWPSAAGVYNYGFGTIRNGFLKGVELVAGSGSVQASEEGEMIFASESKQLPGAYPLQGGSILAVAHGGEMMTIYSGLEPGSLSTYLKNVKKGDILGRGANPDNSRGSAIYVFDRQERQYINPMIVMPGYLDEKVPVIKSVSLSKDGVDIFLTSQKLLPQGSYDLLLDVYDSSPSGAPSAPYDIRILIDGSERAHIVYDAVWSSAGASVLFGGVSLDEKSFMMSDGRIRFGPYTLSRGRVVLTVIVSDYASNTKEQTFALSIQ